MTTATCADPPDPSGTEHDVGRPLTLFVRPSEATLSAGDPMLVELNPEKVCFLIVKLREFGVQAEPNLGGGSDATDDGFVAVFENEADPSSVSEAEGLIEAMNVDEQRELIALSLVGHGDYGKEEWKDAIAAAGSHPEPTISAYLLSNPTVSDDLEEGLSIFGFSCQDFETDRL